MMTLSCPRPRSTASGGAAKGWTAASREVAFFWQQKKARKENCRSFDGADPRPRGCTPLGTPKRKSQGPSATRTQYYCSRLTPTGLAPLLSRGDPEPPLWEVHPQGRGSAPPAPSGEGCRPPLPLSLFLCCSVGRPVLWPPRLAFIAPYPFSCRGRRPRRPASHLAQYPHTPPAAHQTYLLFDQRGHPHETHIPRR